MPGLPLAPPFAIDSCVPAREFHRSRAAAIACACSAVAPSSSCSDSGTQGSKTMPGPELPVAPPQPDSDASATAAESDETRLNLRATEVRMVAGLRAQRSGKTPGRAANFIVVLGTYGRGCRPCGRTRRGHHL